MPRFRLKFSYTQVGEMELEAASAKATRQKADADERLPEGEYLDSRFAVDEVEPLAGDELDGCP